MLSPVTALWAFGCSIFSPSINHLYCCGVPSFCGTPRPVIQSPQKFSAYFFSTDCGRRIRAGLLFAGEINICLWLAHDLAARGVIGLGSELL